MPCFQTNTVSVDFEAANLGLLQQAAAAIGLSVRTGQTKASVEVLRMGQVIAVVQNGSATIRPIEVATLNELRVQYSKEVVNFAAQKLGWQKVAKSENRCVLRKGM